METLPPPITKKKKKKTPDVWNSHLNFFTAIQCKLTNTVAKFKPAALKEKECNSDNQMLTKLNGSMSLIIQIWNKIIMRNQYTSARIL